MRHGGKSIATAIRYFSAELEKQKYSLFESSLDLSNPKLCDCACHTIETRRDKASNEVNQVAEDFVDAREWPSTDWSAASWIVWVLNLTINIMISTIDVTNSRKTSDIGGARREEIFVRDQQRVKEGATRKTLCASVLRWGTSRARTIGNATNEANASEFINLCASASSNSNALRFAIIQTSLCIIKWNLTPSTTLVPRILGSAWKVISWMRLVFEMIAIGRKIADTFGSYRLIIA